MPKKAGAREWLVHLVGLGEVVERLGRGVADRGHRPVQAGDDFLNRNQLGAFRLHVRILPWFLATEIPSATAGAAFDKVLDSTVLAPPVR